MFDSLLPIARKDVWSIVHDGRVIVLAIVVPVSDVLVEVVNVPRFYVAMVDFDEVIPVIPALLMPQSDCVTDLVDYRRLTAPGNQAEVLSSTPHPHERPGSLGRPDVDIIAMYLGTGFCSLMKIESCPIAEAAYRLFDAPPHAAGKTRINGVGDHPVRP